MLKRVDSRISVVLFLVLVLSYLPVFAQEQTSVPAVAASSEGLIPSSELRTLLPATVFFKGRTAPLQMRNAAGIRLKGNSVIWVSLVDSGGYATGTREQYQLYFVTESPIRMEGRTLQPGAYGCGVLSDGSFLVMDIGGHHLLSLPTGTDSAMKRPRPLQIVTQDHGYRLYLGRHYINFATN